MAVRLETSGDELRLVDFPSSGDCTVTWWSYYEGGGEGTWSSHGVTFGNAGAIDGVYLEENNGANNLSLWIVQANTAQAQPQVISGFYTATGPWYFWCLTWDVSASAAVAYYREAADTSLTSQSASGSGTWTIDRFWINDTMYGGEWSDTSIEAVKIWDRVLTADEILAESYFNTPVNMNGLWCWLPLHNTDYELVDHSGNGRNWSKFGTPGPVATTNSPPIPYSPPLEIITRPRTRGVRCIYSATEDWNGAIQGTFTPPNREGNLQVAVTANRSGPLMLPPPFGDFFTEASDTNLDSHDANWGYSWNNSGGVIQVVNANDEIKVSTAPSTDNWILAKYDAPTEPNQSAFIEVESHTTDSWYGVGCRLDGSGNGYVLEAHATGAGAPWRLLRLDAGAITVLDSGTFAHDADGAGLELIAGSLPGEPNRPTRLRAYGWDDQGNDPIDYSLLVDTHDSTYQTGQCGVWFRGSAIGTQSDDWGCTGVEGWQKLPAYWISQNSLYRRDLHLWYRVVPYGATNPNWSGLVASPTGIAALAEFEHSYRNSKWFGTGYTTTPGNESTAVDNLTFNGHRPGSDTALLLATQIFRNGNIASSSIIDGGNGFFDLFGAQTGGTSNDLTLVAGMRRVDT